MTYFANLLVMLLAGLPQSAAPSNDPPLPELREKRERVIKIVTAVESGAGLVVGTSGEHVLIATALHVVGGDQVKTANQSAGHTSGVCPKAAAMTIVFPGRPDVFKGANLVACNPDVDLAILDLPVPTLAATLSEEWILCWNEPRDQERVHVIGHGIEPWKISSVDVVQSTSFEGDSRRFTLSGVGSYRGSSGGPVLNDAGCLLGLFTHHARTSRATRSKEVLLLADVYRLSTNLVGGTQPADIKARRDVFVDVSETLNGYLFQLEAVSAFFHRKNLRGVEISQITNAYNAAFHKWYQRRTALSEAVGSQWGRRRAADFDGVTDSLYTLHNQIVYNKLADLTASLIARGKLSEDERKTLNDVLPLLDAQLRQSRPLVKGLLDRMRPLLSNSQ